MAGLLYLCPPEEAIPHFPCMLCNVAYHTLLSLHDYLTPVCRPCFSMPGSLPTPCFHPLFRMSSSLFLGFLKQLPISVLLLPFMPSTSQFPAFYSLPVRRPPTHIPLQIVLFTPGGRSWAPSCSSVCLSLGASPPQVDVGSKPKSVLLPLDMSNKCVQKSVLSLLPEGVGWW